MQALPLSLVHHKLLMAVLPMPLFNWGTAKIFGVSEMANGGLANLIGTSEIVNDILPLQMVHQKGGLANVVDASEIANGGLTNVNSGSEKFYVRLASVIAASENDNGDWCIRNS